MLWGTKNQALPASISVLAEISARCRNGYLSQQHHAVRGFWQHHLPALTVIHNFDLKRADGTTASQRLFGRQFPNLFAWVMQQMGELPHPRISKKSALAQRPTLQSVPV